MTARMNPGIRTTSHIHATPILGELLPGTFELTLNRTTIVLPLRANKVSSIVLDSQRNVPHDSWQLALSSRLILPTGD